MELASSKQLVAHAHACLSSSQEKSSHNAIDVDEEFDQELEGKYLLERLEFFYVSKGSESCPMNLIEFPPSFKTTPGKPVLFDLAWNFVDYPDISYRAQQKKKGLGGLFGFWR